MFDLLNLWRGDLALRQLRLSCSRVPPRRRWHNVEGANPDNVRWMEALRSGFLTVCLEGKQKSCRNRVHLFHHGPYWYCLSGTRHTVSIVIKWTGKAWNDILVAPAVTCVAVDEKYSGLHGR